MALETLSANELLNFIIYDTISATPFASSSACNVDNSSENATTSATTTTTTTTTTSNVNNFSLDCEVQGFGAAVAQVVVGGGGGFENCPSMVPPPPPPPLPPPPRQQNLSVAQGRKKRRRRQRVCKNKEEAENQRMTHIAVERNRRKQMNEHLAVLRSLMPESYVQRGDQASIVGGAIEFVKELEHHLQALEAHKIQLMQQQPTGGGVGANDTATAAASCVTATTTSSTPFAQFFAYPQFTCSSSSSSSSSTASSSAGQMPMKFTSSSKAAIADIEVTLIETHANVRILSRRRVRQLSRLVTGLQSMCLSILHLNVTTLDPLVLYSISAKVEEGCLLNSADDIAAAVHHILRIIEEEALLCCQA
ncbi:OLC1v1031264C1 [Oldenlandia corymbosa var. corymbosa]|uniref:OLC1v1031264C1 n=1 Tax=Oldenlandia corymbosa var. corymbosa TaxID=529605 RepID=A0AAV1CL07_OLDCO|nr:OLC1v1031264C1 [Oldenlandia corymbosa var. corymbosa]